MILFLDFDGVLHPAQGGELFSSLPLLEGVLRDAAHVRIVISSTWREVHTLDEIRMFFSADLRDRVVGVTPLRIPARAVSRRLAKFRRHAECWAWLGERGEQWLALDEDPTCKNVQLVDGSTRMSEFDAAARRQNLLRSDEPHHANVHGLTTPRASERARSEHHASR